MNAKQELQQEITKRIRTTFIGALASIEESGFGRLREKDGWDQEYDRLRTEILDKGNLQLKQLLKFLEGLSIKYSYVMPVVDPNTRRGNRNG